MKLTRRSAGLLATAALVLGLAGCGGGNTEGATSLTKAEFLKKGNAICAKDNAGMSARLNAYLTRQGRKTPSEAMENKAAVAIVLPIRKEELHSLRSLGAPSGQEHYVDKMLAAWEEGIAKAEEDPHSMLLAGPPYAFYKTYSMGTTLASKSAGWVRRMTMQPPRRSMAILVAVALLASAGCGGGGENATALSKAQFLKRANAICAKGTKEFGKRDVAFHNRHGGAKANESQALKNELQLTITLPIRKRELRLIRALGAPKGDEQYVEKMLAAWEEGIQTGEEEPASLDAGGPSFAFYKTSSMGIHYGLEKCWLG